MANCIIHPIPIYQHGGSKSRITYRFLEFEQLNLVNYVWYIEGTANKVLVDAGGDVDYVTNVMRVPSEEIQTLDSGLSRLGLSFDDIDLVILTHLHHDHVAQACRFPRAKFLVQRDELEFTQNPHPLFAGAFNREFFDGLNLEVINGDAQISEEVSIIKTPGHTPGGQSICIKTGQGVAIVSGLCTVRENFEPPSSLNITMPVIPPALHTNPFDAYDSVLRIKEMADIVVPLHDPEYLQKSSIPQSHLVKLFGGRRLNIVWRCITRSLGLDIGDKRIGVALSDPQGILASPFTIINRIDDTVDVEAITGIVNQQQVKQIVVGLPRSMDGSLGKQAEKVKAFIQKLCSHTEVPVEFRDERLSTVSAKRLTQAVKSKKTREKVRYDAIAAALILQGYLDEAHQVRL